MASNTSTNSRPSKVQSTRCHLCQQETDHDVLECGHYICSYCLTRSGEASCIVCKTQKKRSNLRRLYTALREKHNGLFKPETSYSSEKESFCCICLARKSKVPATHQCLDCADTLCQACSSGHNASSVTHAHKVVQISDVRNGTHCVKAHTSWFHCSEHVQEQYVFFCETCNRLICAICFMKQHRTHSVETVSDTAEKYRGIMCSSREKLRETFEETKTNSLLQEMDKRSNEIYTKKGILLDDIHAKCESLINRILTQENEATARVINFYGTHLRDIEYSKEQTKECSEVAAQLLPLLETIQTDEDPVRILMLYGEVRDVLQQLTMVESQLKKSLKIPRDELCLEVSHPSTTSPFVIKERSAVPAMTKEFLGVSQTAGSGAAGLAAVHLGTEGSVSTNESRMSMETPVYGEKDRGPKNSLDMQNPVTNKAESDLKSAMGDGFKITESLTIVGPFAKSLQKGHASSDLNFPESTSKYDSSSLTNQPGTNLGVDSYSLSNPASTGADLNSNLLNGSISQPPKLKYELGKNEVESKEKQIQGDPASSKKKTSFAQKQNIKVDPSQRQIKWVMKTQINCKIPKDKAVPEIKALGAFGSKDAKIVISDHANKRIRMITGSGKHQRMCCLKDTDDLPFHSIATIGDKIAFVSGLKICIVDKNLSRLTTIELPNILLSQLTGAGTDAYFLPLSRFNDSSVIIGNLPNNMTRVYNVSGQLVSEQQAPVSGPLIAISSDNKDQLLFSSWYPPGAVYLIRKNGQVVQTFRPADQSVWYPEGTCVDRLDNVYVANSNQCLIQVFHPDGGIISTLSFRQSLITPRCLTMTSYGCLYVAGSGSGLLRYNIETKK